MYQPSQNFINELNKTSRLFRARITYGTDTLTEEIKKMIFTLGSCGADTFTIGSVFASYVDITLSSTETSLAGKEMFVEIGLLLPDDTVEYIPMGYFTASPADISKSRDQTVLKATDRISSKCGGLYIPSITFPATIQAIMSDVSTQAGITIKTSLPTTGVIQKEMKNLTCRDVIGFLAGLLGGFCYADREGNICIAAYPSTSSLTIENERSWTMEMGEEYSVDSLKVIVSEGGEDADGNEVAGVSYSAGSGNGITVSNQYMTESLFNDMKSRVLNYNFCSGTARILGDPRLDPADAITVINFAGKEFFVPCMSITHEYDGGLATTITTPSQAASDEEVRGPLTQQVEQLAADMVLTKEVVAKKITADEANIKFATIEMANIIEAEIKKVSGEFADYKVIVTEDFTAVNAEINTVKGDLADYKTVIADDFTAVNAEITTVKGDLADYKTVVAGDIDALSGRITLVSGELADYKTVVSNELITAKGWMAEGSIGNAQISSVDAAKIKSGILDTALVTVKGTNGNLQIIDNTISISDSARVRVQVGKDGTGDYTLAVWDAAGNLIWDALGATENTIQRPIIRDEVVADDAAIKGTKLDIESVVAAVNGATTKISGTVVQVGNKTLNVALSEQETTITEQGQQISYHETRITANEESIQLKVSSQDFETYKSTVNGEITTVKSRLSTAETSITAMEGQIALKVEQTDIDTAISNVEIGGRNLLLDSEKGYYANGSDYPSVSTREYGKITITDSGKGDSYCWIQSKYAVRPTDLYVNIGDSFTYSIDIKVTGLFESVSAGLDCRTMEHVRNIIMDSGNIFNTENDGKWVRIYATGIVTSVGEDYKTSLFSFGWKGGTVGSTIEYRHPKLEKGNKATDWTPAPEDTEESITTISNKQSEIITNLDSITARVSSVESAQTTQAGEVVSMESRLTVAEQLVTKDGIISTVGSYYTTLDDVNGAVNEIEVGGRNLFLQTKTFGTPWFGTATPTVDTDGFWYSRLRNTWGSYIRQTLVLEDITYTISFYAKAESTVTLEIKDDSENNKYLTSIQINTTDWSKYSVLIKPTVFKSTPDIAFLTRQDTTDIYIKKIKLEKGNKATDWTPAPEDMVDKANIISCINQTAEEITIQANKISLEGLVTANSNFKILEDGSMETIAGTIGGWSIINNKIYSENPYSKTETIDTNLYRYNEGNVYVNLNSNADSDKAIEVLYDYDEWYSDDTTLVDKDKSYISILNDGTIESIYTRDIEGNGTDIVTISTIIGKGELSFKSEGTDIKYESSVRSDAIEFYADGNLGLHLSSGNINCAGDITSSSDIYANGYQKVVHDGRVAYTTVSVTTDKYGQGSVSVSGAKHILEIVSSDYRYGIFRSDYYGFRAFNVSSGGGSNFTIAANVTFNVLVHYVKS